MANGRVAVKLIGGDGNAFAILAKCRRAAKNAGWDKARIDAIMKEMTAGDYNDLLMVAMKYFEVK